MTALEEKTARVLKLSASAGCYFPHEWYELAVEGHFWFEWRLTAFLRQLRFLRITTAVAWTGLDIGCGTGLLRRQVEQNTAWRVDGVDLNEEYLHKNRSGRGKTFLYDIYDRHPRFEERYDFILLFDVLEHIFDTRGFLKAALYHLKPEGWVFVNVPAHQSMMSHFDKAVGHLRRYNKSTLAQEMKGVSLDLKDIRYWGALNLPLLLMRKLNPISDDSGRIIEAGLKPPANWINELLIAAMRAETALLSKPWLGSSLLAAACKCPTSGNPQARE